MSLTPVTVTIGKPNRTKVDGGGRAVTYDPVPGSWKATRNFYGRTSQMVRLEQAAHNAQGPGLETRKLQLFTFRPPFPPDIDVNYRLTADDAKKYIVQFVRTYTETMQVDAELVG